MNRYYSNGKLLITGEYVVLDGALSFALPTQLGQSLSVTPIETHEIQWQSFDEKGQVWYKEEFNLIDGLLTPKTQANEFSERLISIFKAIKSLHPDFLGKDSGYRIETHLDFNKAWGLGTSSTLITNLANWAKVDAYALLGLTFGGSGYDIACAQHHSPLTYQLINNTPDVKPVTFNPEFKNHLYFVYLNAKQNSRDAIAQYKMKQPISEETISDISTISKALIAAPDLTTFQELMNSHEAIISKIVDITPVKASHFPDFKGAIKSLGAWGGDFVLVASEENPETYFNRKGYSTIIPYSNLIL